jgi:isopentenyl diphosphate isomerase/L-lactate dehydrogenase-like FMN-dependent dehydrogenase
MIILPNTTQDGAIGTADALPRCAAAVARRVPGSTLQIFVDGGVRRGKDIVRALALGATAVLLGRPIHWGLCLGGSDGATKRRF